MGLVPRGPVACKRRGRTVLKRLSYFPQLFRNQTFDLEKREDSGGGTSGEIGFAYQFIARTWLSQYFYKNFFFVTQIFYIYQSWILVFSLKSEKFQDIVCISYQSRAEPYEHMRSVRCGRGDWSRHRAKFSIIFRREA